MGTSQSLLGSAARAKAIADKLNFSENRKLNSSENTSDMFEDCQDWPEDLPPLEVVPECGICLDSQEELLLLGCGHTFCETCIQGQLKARWPGSRMNFSYLNCALCRVPMVNEQIKAQLSVHRDLQSRVASVALQKFSDDGLSSELQQELGRLATDAEVSTRALLDMTVFQCCDCQEPYCAGRMDCAAAAQYDNAEAPPTRCPACEWETLACANDHRCMVHGHRFAMFKCDSCCEVATWNCYSNHYCERCHNQAGEKKHYPCPGPEKCALGMLHPPNQEAVHCSGDFASFCIGCTACLGCTEAQDQVTFNDKVVFGFEERWLQFTCGREVLDALGEQAVRARLKIMQPDLADAQNELSAEMCADQLLPLAVESFKKSLEEAEMRAQKVRHEQEQFDEMWARDRRIEAEEERRQHEAERLFKAEQDEELLHSGVALDWKALREHHHSEHALRSSARRTKLEMKKRRLISLKQVGVPFGEPSRPMSFSKARKHRQVGVNSWKSLSREIAEHQLDSWDNECGNSES